MNNNYFYHIVSIEYWNKFIDQEFYQSETFEEEKFIHLSYQNQVNDTLNRYYSDLNHIFVLKITSQNIIDFIKIEASPSGELFPHLYCPLFIKNVENVFEFKKSIEFWEIEL